MQDEDFEWDGAKAATNWRIHGITFEMAREMFEDIFAVKWADDRHGDTKQRFIILGMVENRLLFVSYTTNRRADSYHLGQDGRTLREKEVSQ